MQDTDSTRRNGGAKSRSHDPRKTRRRAALPALLGVLCLFLALPAPARAEDTHLVDHQRADAALEKFLVKYWRQQLNYFRDQYPGTDATGYWTYAQGFDAVLDGVERSEGQRFEGLIETLYQAQAARGWFASYYDDECWMALALVRAYDLTERAAYLAVAEELFQDIRNAWDETCCGDVPGGIWWDRAHTQKATASNAGPVILGARLAQRTGNDSYLEFARKAYDFWLARRVDPVTFQVADHIEADGRVVQWKFTYNEGLMIGAGVELYRATGETSYLETSRNIAGFMLAHEVESTETGNVLTDGDESACTGDCHAFKGPAYRYLAELYRETQESAYLDVLRASAESIWQQARVTSDGFFGVSWTQPPVSTTYSEPQMAAAVMALNIYARWSGPYPGTSRPPGRHEAEEATIQGVGLEAKFGEFSGWGYVAGWQGPSQEVHFLIHVPEAGLHSLDIRYAAAATDAMRAIEINGVRTHPAVYFNSTWSWDSFATLPLEIELPAGEVVLSIVYDFEMSVGYLNLDFVDLKRAPDFRRGDTNVDGQVDMSDAISVLRYLFLGVPERLDCLRSADADDSGILGITDAVLLLNFLFLDGPDIPNPDDCGVDETPDSLGCVSFPPCE